MLGLLGLLEVGPPLAFALIAMLCIGFALVTGGALTARFMPRPR